MSRSGGTTTTSTLSPVKSSLAEQLDNHNAGDKTPRGPSVTPKKARSLSDAPHPVLMQSPAFREPRRMSKDDTLLESPTTPRSTHTRGLSLTMPARESALSPKLEASHIYGSPASMLPRRSRGLDYTRACTNLHHSTLAESSPDASPITSRINIPQRRSLVGGSTVLDSPSNMAGQMWSTMPERTALSSSVSSINMLESDSDSTSSSDDDMAIDDDPMLSTPGAARLKGNVMGVTLNSPGTEWMQQSPAQMNLHSNLLSFRRRARRAKSQHSSSSVSIKSGRPSPGPLSPGIVKSVETNGYFGSGLTRQQVQSRRESLSLGTDALQLSDSEEGSAVRPNAIGAHSGVDAEGPRGVIRRAVTRRSNLLPKSKGFARIKAALIEESMPVDSEVRREAEIVKQVQDNDPNYSPPNNHLSPDPADDIKRSIEGGMPIIPSTSSDRITTPPMTFSQQAGQNSSSVAGQSFWDNNAFGIIRNDRYRTPPPPSLQPRDSSYSAFSDSDMASTTDNSTLSQISTTVTNNNVNGSDNLALRHFQRSRSRSTTPLAGAPPTAGDVARRVNNKRRRDDDLYDIADFTKRRAVSPGFQSVQSSPVLPQSPVAAAADKSWGRPPSMSSKGGTHTPNGPNERSNSGSSNVGGSSNGLKKGVGLLRMDETSEGLLSMTID
ncbi:uncharacterized protein AB675_5034 [Cyphellophora attinorum]|uniref:Uncharacterized protein n=1 Tax=Cyphellophora attinorum TaxID=1664694 RepID=A0A0N1H3B6_9EURO|nr:uncharacterized protein AB675_5034 [Phialophora attinorum]KPI39326.1 hypothetical protein AB675_5034 [Phialophora attinorum]